MIQFINTHVEFIIGTILLPIFLYFYIENNKYYKIIEKFKNKLPPPNKKAQKLTKNEIDNNNYLPPTAKIGITVLNAHNHQVSLTQSDIDQFFKELENFEYKWFFLFKKYYKDYTSNLKRFNNAKSSNTNFDLIMIQSLLEDYDKPLKFNEVFIYHIKNIWITSKFYLPFKNNKIFDGKIMNFNVKI